MANTIKDNGAVPAGGNPGNGHHSLEPSGAAGTTTRDVEDHTRQDADRAPDDAERSKNPGRVDRDSDRRGAGDRSNDAT